jgi:hypothetical protein
VSQNYLLPGGQIRATARLRLKKIGAAASQEQQALYRLINQAQREPVHCLMLQADRYPDDQARQIHQRLTHWDGWGRALQSKQKTEPGLAHAVAADGTLIVENQRLQQVSADPRWRVSVRSRAAAIGPGTRSARMKTTPPSREPRGCQGTGQVLGSHAWHQRRWG